MADWSSNLDDDAAATGLNPNSPLGSLGIDPDEANLDRAGALDRVRQSPLARIQAAYNRAGSVDAPAAMPQPSPTPTAAAVSRSGTSTPAPKSPVDYSTAGLEGLQNDMNLATQATQAIPTDNAEETALEDKRATDAAAKPVPTAPQYKPSGWAKFGRGLEAAGLGLATGGLRGAIAGAIKPDVVGVPGYNAPNRQYGVDAAANTNLLASDDQQLAQAQQRWKDMVDARKAQSGDFRADATLGKDLTSGANQLMDSETKAVTDPLKAQADLARTQNESPAAKAALNDAEFNQRGTQADRLGLKGTMRSLYILNGKVPDPRQVTAEEIASANATRIFTQEHGHPPQTLAELQQVQQAARGTGGTGVTQAVTRLAKPYQADLSSSSAQLEKIDEAKSLVNGNAEAQALGIPKALTALVSGQGTGVRITQAELNAIARARGWQGDFEGTLNSAAGKGNLSKTQQQQLSQILDDARSKIVHKQQIANDALDEINSANSPEEAAAADKKARDRRQKMESGAAPADNPSAGGPPQSVVDGAKEGQYIHSPDGTTYQKKNGKAVMVTN